MSAPGTPAACTAAPIPVERHTDEDWRGVTLDLTQQTDLLVLLARAVCDAGLLGEFIVLGRGEYEPRHALALHDLLSRQAVREALTLTLDGPDANDLGVAIVDAADDRVCCHCNHRAVIEGSAYCPPCQDAVDHLDSVRAAS